MSESEQVERAAEALIDALKGLGGRVLKGAAADLEAFAQEMAGDLVLAAQAGRPDLVAEIQGQVRTIAESHRLQAQGITWEALGHVVGTLAGLAVKVAGGAL